MSIRYTGMGILNEENGDMGYVEWEYGEPSIGILKFLRKYFT